jgi:hypothetical protein
VDEGWDEVEQLPGSEAVRESDPGVFAGAPVRLPVVRVLPDGTYLSVLADPALRGPRRDAILAATAPVNSTPIPRNWSA